jgi:hypothetical protein
VFTETDDINAILPVNPADDLNLSGFASGPIGQRSTMDGQTKRVLLDLPPLASFDDMAAIEIVSLKRKGEDNAYQTIAGPWRFTFVPDVHEDMRFSQRIQISQRVEAGGQVISVEDVHLSATEAVVSYAMHDEPGVFREPIGAPTMHYDEGVSKANTRQEPGTNNFTAHFPPLPEGVDNFSVVFGPSLASVPEQLQITLDLPAISEDSGSTLELDQIVTVDGASLRFTELVMNPSSFTLTYEPANTASSFRILAGPRSDITATDDLGVSYHGESRGTRLDRETGALLWQQLDFSGSLSDAPQSITLTFEGSGRIDPPLPPIEVAVPTRQ